MMSAIARQPHAQSLPVEPTFAHARDRVPDLLRALAPLPCPVDLLVVTTREIERARADGSSSLEMVERSGLVLYERPRAGSSAPA